MSVGLGKFCRHDSGGHGDDAIADNHDKGGQRLAETCFGGDITVAYCGEGYNGPVDAPGNAGETAFRIFNDIHQRTKNNDQGHDDK